MNNTATADQIRNLNDTFRKLEPCEAQVEGVGRWIFTRGVEALVSIRSVQKAGGGQALVKMVQDFNEFTDDNDPYGEHDFLSFDFMGSKVLAKIDYYDKAMHLGSEDPTDTSKTTRVMTLMLSSEY